MIILPIGLLGLMGLLIKKIAPEDKNWLSANTVDLIAKQALQKEPKVSANFKPYTINQQVDKEAFTDFLFSKPMSAQKKLLLENTLCLATDLSSSIHYKIISSPINIIDSLMDSSFSQSIQTTCVQHWFDYQDPNHFYIDFAHATTFGGGYRSYGFVQEEQMFIGFPALALLDFKTQGRIHPCESEDGLSEYPPHAKPTPFIIESIKRQFDLNQTPYGRKLQDASSKDILASIVKVENPVPVNIIGLAAIDMTHREKQYELNDLIYHFEAAYLGNFGAKQLSTKNAWKETVVHTAPWGCGAFLNSEKMMIAIQYLAARIAGVDLVFHGINNPHNPNYTKKDIHDIIVIISNLIDEKKSIKEILEILLQKSLTDPSWSPKKAQ